MPKIDPGLSSDKTRVMKREHEILALGEAIRQPKYNKRVASTFYFLFFIIDAKFESITPVQMQREARLVLYSRHN